MDNTEFLKDIGKHYDILVFAPASNYFFKITKKEAKELAKIRKVKYYITDKVYLLKRNVIVIL